MNKFKIIITLACLFVLVCLAACKRNDNSIAIKGDIKGLDVKWIYLYESFKAMPKPVDSTMVTDGKFEFKLHPDTVFQPFAGVLAYHSKNNHMDVLAIINPFSSTKQKPLLYASLYVEPGLVTLTGDLTKTKGITLTGGKQNDFYFRNPDLPFVYISEEPLQRKAQLTKLNKLVKDNPDAYYLMFALTNLKFYLTKNELQSIYNEFDSKVRWAYNGRKIKEFLNYMTEADGLKPNNSLIDTAGNACNLIDTSKKLNMVIFWASWCGPCKEEIPTLKKIAAEFTDKKFRMVSVSIDVNKSLWKKAVRAQHMSWQQLGIPGKDEPRVIAQYTLNQIPQVYFIDHNRKLVGHVNGFNPSNDLLFKKAIASALE